MSPHRLSRALLGLMLILFSLPAAAAWWNGDWQYRKRLTIDPAVVTSATSAGLTEVSLPVRLHAGNFGYFADVDKAAADVRFIGADDKTPLEFRIERFDAAAGVAVLWVKLPVAQLGAEHSYIWMYYGSANASAASSNRSDDAAVVVGYDFSEGSGAPRDATAYASHATASTAHSAVSGVTDLALGFDPQSSVSLPQTLQLPTFLKSLSHEVEMCSCF